jgi:hypothetical protein
MTIEVLYFDDCPNHDGFVPHLRELLAEHGVAADVTLRRIDSDADAQRFRFLGSPSVRVDDRDVEPGADARTDFGMKCRLYRTPDALTGVPRDRWVLDALGLDPRENDGRVLAEDLLGQRSARDRLEGCPPAYRRLHRRVLQAFVEGEPARGEPPRPAHRTAPDRRRRSQRRHVQRAPHRGIHDHGHRGPPRPRRGAPRGEP